MTISQHLFGVSELGFEAATACSLCLLIVTFTLHMRIKYGDVVVTHITT